MHIPKVDDWEIPACNVIVEQQQLGEGCFGQVFKGVVKGPIVNPKVQPSLKNAICVNVAIKMLKRECTDIECAHKVLVQSHAVCICVCAAFD